MNTVTTITEGDAAVEFTLHLEEIQQLFTAPEFDPFVPQARVTSGMDDITAYLAARRLRPIPKLRTTLLLPADQVTPGLLDEARAAIGRYCEFIVLQTRTHMAASRFEGRNKLPIGLVVAGVTFLLTIILYLALPESARPIFGLLAPVVTVIVWVSIWNPMETLIYDRWADRRELQIAAAIKDMDLAIRAE